MRAFSASTACASLSAAATASCSSARLLAASSSACLWAAAAAASIEDGHSEGSKRTRAALARFRALDADALDDAALLAASEAIANELRAASAEDNME